MDEGAGFTPDFPGWSGYSHVSRAQNARKVSDTRAYAGEYVIRPPAKAIPPGSSRKYTEPAALVATIHELDRIRAAPAEGQLRRHQLASARPVALISPRAPPSGSQRPAPSASPLRAAPSTLSHRSAASQATTVASHLQRIEQLEKQVALEHEKRSELVKQTLPAPSSSPRRSAPPQQPETPASSLLSSCIRPASARAESSLGGARHSMALTLKVKSAELRRQMEAAAERKDYREAARLQDELKQVEAEQKAQASDAPDKGGGVATASAAGHPGIIRHRRHVVDAPTGTPVARRAMDAPAATTVKGDPVVNAPKIFPTKKQSWVRASDLTAAAPVRM